jgi:hypothetical protein
VSSDKFELERQGVDIAHRSYDRFCHSSEASAHPSFNRVVPSCRGTCASMAHKIGNDLSLNWEVIEIRIQRVH